MTKATTAAAGLDAQWAPSSPPIGGVTDPGRRGPLRTKEPKMQIKIGKEHRPMLAIIAAQFFVLIAVATYVDTRVTAPQEQAQVAAGPVR